MGTFPVRRINGRFRLSAADAVTAVAALVFIAGLISHWQFTSGSTTHHFTYDLNLFGLVAGPALLTRTGSGYWTTLIMFTWDAILSVAGLFVMIFLAWEKFIDGVSPWSALDSLSAAIIVVASIVSFWVVITLRRTDVRGIFGV
jgi:hypothetical protein